MVVSLSMFYWGVLGEMIKKILTFIEVALLLVILLMIWTIQLYIAAVILLIIILIVSHYLINKFSIEREAWILGVLVLAFIILVVGSGLI